MSSKYFIILIFFTSFSTIANSQTDTITTEWFEKYSFGKNNVSFFKEQDSITFGNHIRTKYLNDSIVIKEDFVKLQKDNCLHLCLIVWNTKIILDSLFYIHNNYMPNDCSDKNNSLSYCLGGIFSFSFNSDSYLVIYGNYRLEESAGEDYTKHNFLFNINNKVPLFTGIIETDNFLDETCFGDFDEDGVLDALEIKPPQIGNIYSIKNNCLELNKKMNLAVQYDDTYKTYYILRSKSKFPPFKKYK